MYELLKQLHFNYVTLARWVQQGIQLVVRCVTASTRPHSLQRNHL